MPVQDENGEDLDYYDNVNLGKTPGQAPVSWADFFGQQGTEPPNEEDTLLEDRGLDSLMTGLDDLSDAALAQLSVHIDTVRRHSAKPSPIKTPTGPPPGLPPCTNETNQMARAILRVMSQLGQLPTGQRHPTQAPGAEETERATKYLEEQLKAPGTPCHK